MTFRGLCTAIVVAAMAATLRADDSGVRGRITDASELPLPGVTVTLQGGVLSEPVTAVTDTNGTYKIAAPDGSYRLTAELPGFRTADRADIVVSAGETTVNLTLQIASFQEEVTVTTEATHALLTDPEPNAPVVVTRQVIDNAMLPNSRYDDVLTLMPGVVRSPDGQISVGGARPNEGALFVNGINETDPINGQATVTVPIESVDSVQVHDGGYAAEFGPATGGVTSVQTRSGADQFHVSLDSMFPRLLFENGGLHGVEYWEPNIGASGPIMKDRVFFEQGFSYRYDRNSFDTLAGPARNMVNAAQSWSQIDWRLSNAQRIRGAVSINSVNVDQAGITAFVPAGTAPTLNQDVWSASILDRVTTGKSSNLELHLSTVQSGSQVGGYGIPGPYVIAHDIAHGSYFDNSNRDGDRIEGGASFVWTPKSGHAVKVGSALGRLSLDETNISAPVSLLRSDNSVAHVIQFLPTPPLRVGTTELTVFGQDTWTARPWLTVEAGLRYDNSTGASGHVLSPRIAWTAKTANGRTSISGSAGTFADKFVLGALAFPYRPARTVQTFDAAGSLVDSRTYTDVLNDTLQQPSARRWDVSLDRSFTNGWLTQIRYQERYGSHELVVDPLDLTPTTGMLLLSSRGGSRSRAVETTVGYRPTRGTGELYVSYVRSSTRGDLNTFDAIDDVFKDPFIQSNLRGPMPTDVTDRVLAWAIINFPASLSVAPYFDIRSGFPYTPINDMWLNVGPGNTERMPWYASMDLSITRVVDLPSRLPHARIGLKLYHLLNINSEREVQRDIELPTYGQRYDPVPRDFSIVCIFLVGHH